MCLAEQATYRFEEAVKHYTVNVSQHMVKIKAELESQTESDTAALLQKKENLLDELLEIVENIDNAKGRYLPHAPVFAVLALNCTRFTF